MQRYFYVELKYDKIIFLAFIISLFLHIIFFLYTFHDSKKSAIDYKEIMIDEVEFLEKNKIIKLVKKEKMIEKIKEEPKLKEKESKKIEKIEKPETPLLQDKKEEFKKIEKLELPQIKLDKPKELDMPKLDIEEEKKRKIDIKDIETPILQDKNRDMLNADDVKALINLEAVGDKKVSQKTLDLIIELEKTVKVRNISDAPKLELKDNEEKLKNLDRKISNISEAPIINMTNKAFEKSKDLEIETIKNKSNISTFDASKIVVLEDKTESIQKSRQRKIEYVDDRPIKIKNKEVMDIKEEIPKKMEPKIEQKPVIETSLLSKKDIVDKKVAEKNTKKFEITGKIKDRQIVYSIIPEYPSWAQEQGIEAVIYIYFEVNPNGVVLDDMIKIEITSGYKKLDDYVKEILRQWKFSTINTEEIQSGIISFNFKLS
ncbi:MAG: TonB family protein [Elusimicrobiota bacterium]|jgi:TonB family protein|nr:TonB family protein [Elusimicrobiota bacterium]